MRPLLAAVAAVLLPFVISGARAQTTASEQKTPSSMGYDASQEITLHGTVATVVTRAPSGMLAGSHLLLTTLSGPVDVSLGVFGLTGQGALSVTQGQQIETTGVIKIFRGNSVFLARTVKTGDSVYVIRNVHGIPVTPHARLRANQGSQAGEKQ